ncbi:MAG: flagellar biosynthesis protein FliQ [Oscillospiraceae bacterium]
MSETDIMSIMHEAMQVALKLSAPLLIASILVGLIVAIFQAATQIHEQTLTFVPKLLIIAVIFLAVGSWMANVLDDFFRHVFDKISQL